MSDATFDLTQTDLIPLNLAPRSDSFVRIPAPNRLCYNPIATTSRPYSHAAPSSESGLARPSSILGSSILDSSYMGSSAYPAYGGDASTDASNPTTKPLSAKKPEKVTLQYITSKYPKWARALGNLRCMT